MQRKRVISSNLLSVGYDSTSGTLEIEFHSRWVYQYFNVPTAIYQNLMNASSHGSYHAVYIKNNYAYKRIR